jgi:transposase-like protein
MTNRTQLRGLQIATTVGHIRKESETRYLVRSMHSSEWLPVAYRQRKWVCGCTEQRHGVICEHIHAVTTFQSLPYALMMNLNYDLLTCPRCDSGPELHVSVGSRRRKQGKTTRIRCKVCGYTFSDRFAFTRMRNNPALVVTAIDLYCLGLSTRQIQNHLESVHGVETSHMSIHRWVRKYSKHVSSYVKTLHPRVGSELHVDEMVVRSSSGTDEYLWNAMDRETKFLLASVLTTGRTEEEAFSVISQAVAQAKKKPRVAVTDGNPSYPGAVKRNGIARHIFSPKFVDPKNNNAIENFHSQIRPRYDVARTVGLPHSGNALAAAFALSYNFVRPKVILGNRTPAELAGIDLGTRNKWLALATASSRAQKGRPKRFREGVGNCS